MYKFFESIFFLQEASALQMTSLCAMRSLKEEDGQAYLLADLQAEQKKETTYLLAGLLDKVSKLKFRFYYSDEKFK